MIQNVVESLSLQQRLGNFKNQHDQEDRIAFLDYVAFCFSLLFTDEIKLFSYQNKVQPNALRFRYLDAISTTIVLKPAMFVDKTVLSQHLEGLLSISVPIIEKNEIFSADYTLRFIGDDSQQKSWHLKKTEENDYRFRYPLVLLRKQASDLLTYWAELLSIWQDVIEFIVEGVVCRITAITIGHETKEILLPPPYEPFDLGHKEDGAKGTDDKQPLYSISGTEPAIVCLARHWSLLAPLLQIENLNSPIEGFSLLNLTDWVVASSKDPSVIYEYLGRVCNVVCKFCYLFGNPSHISIARGKKVIMDDELATRLRYYDPVKGRSLFQAQWEINEILVDPKLKKTLRVLREVSMHPFYFITNGNPLSVDIIDFLAEVKPVHLIISTNTLDHVLRSSIMKEKESRTKVAYSALERLHEKQIPYGVSVVAFPGFPLEKLEETIYQLNQIKPAFVRINLHGFTRDHPYQEKIDQNTFWGKVVHWVQNLRKRVQIPLIIIPSAFEENYFHDDPNGARVIGAIPGSPAELCGLKPGDIIKKANFFDIQTRSHLTSVLMLQKGMIDFVVERDDQQLNIKLDHTKVTPSYPGPLIAKYFFPFGMVIPPSISLRDIEEIQITMKTNKINSAWIMTSQLMLPSVKQLVDSYASELQRLIYYVIVQNDFLGGNIQVLDMATIGDMARAIDVTLAIKKKPDLIFIPATGFNRLGRDIAGRHWRDLQEWYGIPLKLLSVTTRFAY
jgi:wyosine [tRNA(Phe)-imidazoG37] synthetase (radical SAM superfamily)